MLTEQEVMEALATVKDPELGANIVDLGLIYGVEVKPDGINIRMTATSAACPVQEILAGEAGNAVYLKAGQDGLKVHVDLVFDPPWSPAMATPAVQSFLGF